MIFRSFLKQCLVEYLVICACISAAIGILGLVVNPNAQFGYESYFSPFIFGFISLIPSLVTYSKDELSMKQLLIRKGIHLLLLVALLTGFAIWQKLIDSIQEITLFGIAVVAVYILVNYIRSVYDQKDADEINRLLSSLHADKPEQE